MKIIKILSENIDDELEDAEKYVKLALQEKTNDPSLSDLFYSLAREEMGHMEKLHEAVVKKIKMYRDEKGEPPADMLGVYNYLHEKHTDRAMHIQRYLDKYAGKI